MEKLLDHLKNLASTLATIAGICYAIGFVIVRAYLLRYDISDLALLQVRYISVGLFFLILVTLLWLPFIKFALSKEHTLSNVIDSDMTDNSAKSQEISILSGEPSVSFVQSQNELDLPSQKKIYPASFLLQTSELVLLVLISAVLSNIIIYRTDSQVWAQATSIPVSQEWARILTAFWKLFVWLLSWWYLPVLAIGLILSLGIRSKTWAWRKPFLISSWNFYLIALAVITLCFLTVIKNYAYKVYPFVTPALGGGGAVEVQLTSKDQSKELKDIFKQLNKSSQSVKKIASIWLLDQSDKNYFILACNDICTPNRRGFFEDVSNKFNTLQIDKGLIQSVVYLTSDNQAELKPPVLIK